MKEMLHILYDELINIIIEKRNEIVISLDKTHKQYDIVDTIRSRVHDIMIVAIKQEQELRKAEKP